MLYCAIAPVLDALEIAMNIVELHPLALQFPGGFVTETVGRWERMLEGVSA